MPCYHPLSAFQTEGGDIVFVERGKILRTLTLPCGQCIGCRLERSRQWAVRCLHESQMHDSNAFVTLTYADEKLPPDLSLRYRDYQLFMKRLRKVKGGVRFFACGEYGETTARPHFHACLFGVEFSDMYPWRMSSAGFQLYRSDELERLWSLGHCEIGHVTFDSAAYVARYVVKKVTGRAADDHYLRELDDGTRLWLEPEFARMSLKPGLGATWFDKYKSEVFPLDRVVVNGVESKPPKYYDDLLKLDSSFLRKGTDVEYERMVKSLKTHADSTPTRLAAREHVAKARLSTKLRGM